MYSKRPNLVLGFHGCDKTIADSVIRGECFMNESTNDYDWLGHGIYFWENNLSRAFEFAEEQKNRDHFKGKPKVENPAVIGAIIDLGLCLDLLDSENLQLIKFSYKTLVALTKQQGTTIPKNKKGLHSGEDLLVRQLDCAVIENIHSLNDKENITPYDTARGVFWEGDNLYPNAGFKEKIIFKYVFVIPIVLKAFSALWS